MHFLLGNVFLETSFRERDIPGYVCKLSMAILWCLCTQEAYSAVVEFFGENPKTFVPTSFFPLFVRFIKAYKVCMCDI